MFVPNYRLDSLYLGLNRNRWTCKKGVDWKLICFERCIGYIIFRTLKKRVLIFLIQPEIRTNFSSVFTVLTTCLKVSIETQICQEVQVLFFPQCSSIKGKFCKCWGEYTAKQFRCSFDVEFCFSEKDSKMCYHKWTFSIFNQFSRYSWTWILPSRSQSKAQMLYSNFRKNILSVSFLGLWFSEGRKKR